MAINPIGGPGAVQHAAQVASAGKTQPAAPGKFNEALQGYLRSVDQDQQASAEAVQNLLSGKTEDVLPAVTAMARADMSFKLLVGVRNKMIEAYKQTLNMQV
ncbi:MAG: flagellar hook-basal body complex protein FliE [Phycisphaerae bacterium]|nr:flagellar hook-basal body complex protein FliE [Phycisphaerae bacterium]